MRRMKRALAIAASLALSACATLTSDDCARGNWYEIGRMDGLHGHKGERIERHRDACRKFPPPNEREYERGRHDGLKVYCSQQDGAALARSGERFEHPCTGTTAPEFDAAYHRAVLEQEQEKKRKDGGW